MCDYPMHLVFRSCMYAREDIFSTEEREWIQMTFCMIEQGHVKSHMDICGVINHAHRFPWIEQYVAKAK